MVLGDAAVAVASIPNKDQYYWEDGQIVVLKLFGIRVPGNLLKFLGKLGKLKGSFLSRKNKLIN